MEVWELVIIWDNGDKDIYKFRTEEEAVRGGKNLKMAFGNQIAWHGIRKV